MQLNLTWTGCASAECRHVVIPSVDAGDMVGDCHETGLPDDADEALCVKFQ